MFKRKKDVYYQTPEQKTPETFIVNKCPEEIIKL